MKTSFFPTSVSNYLRTIFYRYLLQSVLVNGHCFWPYLSKLKLKLNLNIILCVNATFSSVCRSILGPVVQKVDNAIHWINLCPVADSSPVVSNLSLLINYLLGKRFAKEPALVFLPAFHVQIVVFSC